MRAAAPPAFLVQLLLACPRGWEAQHLSWQPLPGEAVQTGRNSPWGCCLPWAIPGLGPAGILEPSVSGGVRHLATLHLLPRSTLLPNEAHSAAQTPCSLAQARPGRPSHGILPFPQPAPPSVEGSGPGHLFPLPGAKLGSSSLLLWSRPSYHPCHPSYNNPLTTAWQAAQDPGLAFICTCYSPRDGEQGLGAPPTPPPRTAPSAFPRLWVHSPPSSGPHTCCSSQELATSACPSTSESPPPSLLPLIQEVCSD